MLDSIHVGVTGLMGYQQGLRVIANNTANLNTPGYKSSTLQFTDLFYARSPAGGQGTLDLGHGLGTTGTHLNFRPGDLRPTPEREGRDGHLSELARRCVISHVFPGEADNADRLVVGGNRCMWSALSVAR